MGRNEAYVEGNNKIYFVILSAIMYSYLLIFLVEIVLHSEMSVELVYLLQIPAQLVP